VSTRIYLIVQTVNGVTIPTALAFTDESKAQKHISQGNTFNVGQGYTYSYITVQLFGKV
jgi:hypothetical protein